MTQKHSAYAGKMQFFLFSSILWTGFLLPLNTWAQNDSTKKATQLKEVQIREYRLTEQSKSPTPLQILSGEDLKRINSLSVADAIRYFSGVQLKDYGGIGGLKTVNVRSLGTNHTAVFLDGIQIGNAQNGQVDLGKFSLSNLEEIALYSGQKPELLIPAKGYASASSIYLKTKEPDFEGNQRQQVELGLKSGSFGLINPSLIYRNKINENLIASINTEYIHADGKYKFRYTNGVFDTTAVRNNGDVERFRLQAALFGKFRNGKWHAQAYSFLSDRGLPGAIVANRFDFTQRIWDRDFFIQGSIEKNLSDKFSIIVNGKCAYVYQRYLDPDYVTTTGFLDNRFKEQEAYLSVSGKYKISSVWEVAYASDYTFQTLDANIYRFPYPSRNTFLNVLSSSLTLEQLTIQANVLSTTVIDHVKLYSSAGNKQVFSPTVMLSWKFLKDRDIRVRAFYKDIFRMPTFNDLYYTFIGNTLLKPEYTKQYDVGITYFKNFKNQQLKFIDIQSDVYFNRVKDKIVAQPGANLYRWIMYNIGLVDIHGLEINAKTAFEPFTNLLVNVGLNYTYQKAVDVTSKQEENYKDQIPYIPENSGSFLARLDYQNWHANYGFIYTGFRYNQKANNIYNYMEPWYTHDAAIGYEFKLKKGSININCEVNNLLNQYYDLIPNFPMPGRNYRLTLNYKL
ncbi:TonB-dependent receptor [Pedobacter sp. MR2016-19]|uniref:TonB-dependent receptor plug domain-containing protein n=1 Tax=Pedobacter sp. MR2016-19 TaxID=2780089 RepID=UPI0018765608|nr:TonB-dependent receptor [Pedobacter sp. MR2016-19]MBE5319322.1 TonB-dependent receptor [Pedobacter sp. MR2016-19]